MSAGWLGALSGFGGWVLLTLDYSTSAAFFY
jgi:hypothetical protein